MRKEEEKKEGEGTALGGSQSKRETVNSRDVKKEVSCETSREHKMRVFKYGARQKIERTEG